MLSQFGIGWKTRWTPDRTAVQFSNMRRSFVVLLLWVTPALAQEKPTAYEALRVVGSEMGRGALNHVVSITGERGDPQPDRWKVVLEQPDGRSVREIEVADGKIDSEQRPGDSVGSTEGATIDTSRLNLDSSGAYEVASHTAELSHVNFATVDYTLRTDGGGEPTWIITLLSPSSRPVGTIHIGAASGTVKRTDGMFAGTTMEDVENEDDEGDDENGPFRGVKRRIKDTFHRTQDEARDMFDKVRRSFTDFINR
jgi:hypothetical protein